MIDKLYIEANRLTINRYSCLLPSLKLWIETWVLNPHWFTILSDFSLYFFLFVLGMGEFWRKWHVSPEPGELSYWLRLGCDCSFRGTLNLLSSGIKGNPCKRLHTNPTCYFIMSFIILVLCQFWIAIKWFYFYYSITDSLIVYWV